MDPIDLVLYEDNAIDKIDHDILTLLSADKTLKLPMLASSNDWQQWIGVVRAVASNLTILEHIDPYRNADELQPVPSMPTDRAHPHYSALRHSWLWYRRAAHTLRWMVYGSLPPYVKPMALPSDDATCLHTVLKNIRKAVIPDKTRYQLMLVEDWYALHHTSIRYMDVLSYMAKGKEQLRHLEREGVLDDKSAGLYYRQLLEPLRQVSVWRYSKVVEKFFREPRKVADIGLLDSAVRATFWETMPQSVYDEYQRELSGSSRDSGSSAGGETPKPLQQQWPCPACKGRHAQKDKRPCFSAAKALFPDSPHPALKSWNFPSAKARKAVMRWLAVPENKQLAEDWHASYLQNRAKSQPESQPESQLESQDNISEKPKLLFASCFATSTDDLPGQMDKEVILATAASEHIFNNRAYFDGPIRDCPEGAATILTGMDAVTASGIGNVKLRLTTSAGTTNIMTLRDVYYCPEFPTSMLSVSRLAKHDIFWSEWEGALIVHASSRRSAGRLLGAVDSRHDRYCVRLATA